LRRYVARATREGGDSRNDAELIFFSTINSC
jgi:hypothetical protein